MGALVLKSVFQRLIETFVYIKHLRFYAPLRIHPSANVLLVVNIWNCQNHITFEVFNFKTPIDSPVIIYSHPL